MSPREAVLGPMSRRQKTDVRLPFDLSRRVEELSDALGVPKNAFFALAASLLCMQMAPLVVTGKKREILLREMKNLFEGVFDKIEKMS